MPVLAPQPFRAGAHVFFVRIAAAHRPGQGAADGRDAQCPMLFRALNDGGKFEWEGDIFHLAAIPLAVLNSRIVFLHDNLSVAATQPWTHMTVPDRRLRRALLQPSG